MEKNLEDSEEEKKMIQMTEERKLPPSIKMTDLRDIFLPHAKKLSGVMMGIEKENVYLFERLEVLTAKNYVEANNFAIFYYKKAKPKSKIKTERWGKWLFEVKPVEERSFYFMNWGVAMLFEWINYKSLINYHTDLLKQEEKYGKDITEIISRHFIESIQGMFYSISTYERVSKSILDYARKGIEIDDTLHGRYLYDYQWMQWSLPTLGMLEEGYALIKKDKDRVGYLMNPGKTIKENMALSIETFESLISAKEMKPTQLFQTNMRAQREEYDSYEKENIMLEQIGLDEGGLYSYYSSKKANIGVIALELDSGYFKYEEVTAIIVVTNFSPERLSFRDINIKLDVIMTQWLNFSKDSSIEEMRAVKNDLEQRNETMMNIISEIKESELELDKAREESLELNFRGSVPKLEPDKQGLIYEKRLADFVGKYELDIPALALEVEQNRKRKEFMKEKIRAKREQLMSVVDKTKDIIIDLPKKQKNEEIAPLLIEIKKTTDVADAEEIAEEKPKDEETVYLPDIEEEKQQEELKQELHKKYDEEIEKVEAIIEQPSSAPHVPILYPIEEEDKVEEDKFYSQYVQERDDEQMGKKKEKEPITDDEAIEMYEKFIALKDKSIVELVALESYLKNNWKGDHDHPLWGKIKHLKADLREKESNLPEPEISRKKRKTEGRNEFILKDREIRDIVAGGEKRGEIVEAFRKKREKKKLTKDERNLLYSESIRFAVQAAILTGGKEELIRKIIKSNYVRLYKGGKEEEPKIDLRPYTKFTDIYDLVEIPPINIGKFNKEELWNVADVLGDMGMLYQNQEKKVGIEYVYYIYKKGERTFEEDSKGNKKWTGASGGGSILLYVAKDDTSTRFKSMVHSALMSLVDNYSKGEIYGSGQIKIDVLLKNRALYKEGEKADLFLQYMKVRKTDDLNPELLYELKAFSSNLAQVHKAVREMVCFGSKIKNGLCLFEAYLIIKEGGKRRGIDWKDHILSAFISSSSVVKNLVVNGNMIEFLEFIYSTERLNIPLYNAANHTIFVAEEDKEFTKYCMVYYASHVYVGTLEKIANSLEVKDENKFLGIRKYERTKKFKECLPYKMRSSKEEKSEAEGSVKHIHWSLDFETYSVDDKGFQEPYLLVVKRHGEYSPNIFTGRNCTIDFIFEILVPIVTEKKQNEQNHFWSYNGANFDFHFLIKGLQLLFPLKLFGSETSVKTLKLENGIDFLDLACWYNIPFDKDHENKGLGALARKCKTKYQKTSFDHAVTKEMLDDQEFKEKSQKYCVNDVNVLEELVELLVVNLYEKFSYNGRKACRLNSKNYPHSSASLSTTIFKNCFLRKGEELTSSPIVIYEKERKSYHGGLTIAFKMVSGKVRVFDINSSYPWVMTQKMPYRYLSTWINYSKVSVPEKDIMDTFLYAISSFEFPKGTFLPCLMVKATDGSLTQLRTYSAENEEGYIYAWGIEVKQAMKLGAKVKIEEIHEYSSICVFEEYVKFFYAKKAEAKLNKNIVEEIFYKNLLNSLQGKLGQRNQDVKSFGLIHMLANEIFQRGFEKVKEIEYLKSGIYKIVWEDGAEGINKIGSLVRFPSYIAAYGRIKLVQGIYSVDTSKVVYCDTDSIMLEDDCSLPADIVSETELGLFKEELDKKCDIGLFFGAKNYVLIKANNAKIHCKGARTFEDPKKYCDSLLKGETIISEINPVFVKRFGEVYITKIKRELSNTIAMKRVIVSDKQTRCFENIAEHAAAIERITEKKKKTSDKKESVTHLVHKEIKERMLKMFNEIIRDQKEQKEENLGSYFEEAKIPREIKTRLTDIIAGKADLEEKLSELLLNTSMLYDPNKILELRNAIMDIDKNLDEEINKVANILTNEKV